MRAVLLALAVLPIACAASAAENCAGVFKMQGFFSRAQFQCGLTSNDHRTLPQVESCSKGLSERQVASALTPGMQMYDAQEAQRGRAATCSELAKSFPAMMGR